MFNRIVNFARDVRIKFDYSRYEKQCRLEYVRRAEATHSTHQLEIELSAKATLINEQTEHLFRSDITNFSSEIEKIKKDISEKKEVLKLFTRNYDQELQGLHDHKDALLTKKKDVFSNIDGMQVEISYAINKKNLAYASLKHYQSCIDSWHSKSSRTPWLFGNGGKKLPEHSLFGQSFGDLDSYKCHRDDAKSDVQSCKNEIEHLLKKKRQLGEQVGELKNSVDATFSEIHKVKSDRNQMYELKKEGHTKKQLNKTLNDLDERLIILQSKINSLENDRAEFINAESYRQGVVDLEINIKNIKNKMKLYIHAFDLDEERNARIKEHRQIWLHERELI